MDEKTFFKLPFTQWCMEATYLIKFGPDRDAVSAELYDHLTDHFEELVAQGVPEEEARAQTLEAMGSAKEIAPQLAAIHRPFWGYVLRISKIALIVLLCISILPVWNYFKDLNVTELRNYWGFAVYDSASYGGDTGRTLHHLSEPNLSFSTDGSTFTVTDAAVFTVNKDAGTPGNPELMFLIRQISPIPWTEQKDLFTAYEIVGWFYVRDDLGNLYEGYMRLSGPETGRMFSHGTQSGVFTYTHECRIINFPEDAQWVEIGYDRDGRDCSVRVYLTGGDHT